MHAKKKSTELVDSINRSQKKVKRKKKTNKNMRSQKGEQKKLNQLPFPSSAEYHFVKRGIIVFHRLKLASVISH